jgi:hypothetical protein
MYKSYIDFITDTEQQLLIEYVNKKILDSNNKLKSYAHHANIENKLSTNPVEPLYYFYIEDDLNKNDILNNIVRRMQKFAQVSEENPKTYFNWVVSIAPIGSEVIDHRDPLDEELLKTKKIVRINLLIKNATRGGKFELLQNDKWIDATVPDKALMIFDASDVFHRITKNISNVTRINLSIDSVIDR